MPFIKAWVTQTWDISQIDSEKINCCNLFLSIINKTQRLIGVTKVTCPLNARNPASSFWKSLERRARSLLPLLRLPAQQLCLSRISWTVFHLLVNYTCKQMDINMGYCFPVEQIRFIWQEKKYSISTLISSKNPCDLNVSLEQRCPLLR